MAKIIIPTPLRKFTENLASINTTGVTVAEAFEDITSSYPELKEHLYDNSGNIRPFVKIFVGDDDIKALQNEATPIKDNSIVSIIPAIAGGMD